MTSARRSDDHAYERGRLRASMDKLESSSAPWSKLREDARGALPSARVLAERLRKGGNRAHVLMGLPMACRGRDRDRAHTLRRRCERPRSGEAAGHFVPHAARFAGAHKWSRAWRNRSCSGARAFAHFFECKRAKPTRRQRQSKRGSDGCPLTASPPQLPRASRGRGLRARLLDPVRRSGHCRPKDRRTSCSSS